MLLDHHLQTKSLKILNKKVKKLVEKRKQVEKRQFHHFQSKKYNENYEKKLIFRTQKWK